MRTLKVSAWQLVEIKGETAFHLIQTMRLWNASHGGVYAEVTEKNPANPYLNVPERDIKTPSERLLTLINPAYMTRQLGEMLKDTKVEIHLTSLNPLNSNNYPDAWEKEALLQFEQGQTKMMTLSQNLYRYMQPLTVEKPCLECHVKQGDQQGDLRGGLSISFPSDDIDVLLKHLRTELIWTHQLAYIVLWLIALLTQIIIQSLSIKLQVATQKQGELRSLASTDELTQLFNRRHLLQSFTNRYQLAISQNEPLSVLMIDIDHFKKVNDQYGHQMGDQVLRRFADELTKNLRDYDLSGRYGGEEFMVTISANIELASSLAERIRHTTESLSFYADETFNVSISIGIAERQLHHTTSPESLIQLADKALYQAKESGRNRVCIYPYQSAMPLQTKKL